MSKEHGWQLEAWAVMANHYHFVARGNPRSTNLGDFLQKLHYASACALNALDGGLVGGCGTAFVTHGSRISTATWRV
jgi:hypothetical protein